ncbi:MAG: ribosome maturation factor RimP [Alphaproteobacteria bacterium]
MNTEERIKQIIESSVNAEGFDLVRVLFSGAEKDNTLQIMVERLDGTNMTSDDCEKLSRSLSALLDVEDVIQSRYLLEITSPGIDRPLVKLADYDRFKGREAKIETLLPIDGRKRFKGELLGTDGKKIILNFEGKEIKIDFEAITKAKLVLTDELLKQMLKGEK